ncbi:hypothetical protein GCM10020229_00400 [Kitasatospora albolonga]|uniref:hypothetical protein n=1 Tax=Kitasatospora albolonga TaxID=68173 RepID=UPI0031F08762
MTAPQAHFAYFLAQLSPRDLAYTHVLEGDKTAKAAGVDYRALRCAFTGTYIANNGYNLPRAQKTLNSGHAHMVAFGTPFIANPDLVRRYRDDLPLAAADPTTFYGGGATGYTDHPYHPGDENAAPERTARAVPSAL